MNDFTNEAYPDVKSPKHRESMLNPSEIAEAGKVLEQVDSSTEDPAEPEEIQAVLDGAGNADPEIGLPPANRADPEIAEVNEKLKKYGL